MDYSSGDQQLLLIIKEIINDKNEDELANHVLKLYKSNDIKNIYDLLGKDKSTKLIENLNEIESKEKIAKIDNERNFKKISDDLTSIYLKKQIPESIFPKNIKNLEKDRKGEIFTFLTKLEAKNTTINGEDTVENKMDEIFKKLSENQILLVQGNTGCGKTTKIPLYLMSKYKNIICTQPRKIAAISIAKKVSNDLKCSLGSTVGYTVRFDDCTSSRTQLRYVTDGVLLREIQRNKYLKGYDLIIIDEAHERTVNIDILLAYIKSIKDIRKDLRLIIMSATISADKFVSFFGCPIVEIKHKIFPLEKYFLKKEEDDYIQETVWTIIQIHKTCDKGDILVFLTGQSDIKLVASILSKELNENEVTIRLIYSTLSPEQQDLVFIPSSKRKIVLATNIAETSITIENIVYVVDCGKFKQLRFSPSLGMNILDTIWISKAQANQRAGRAGRTQPGKVFRIYTKKDYVNMKEDTQPEITSISLCGTILMLKVLGINDVLNFDLIDRPDIQILKKGLETLYFLRLIEDNGFVTEFGKKVSRIPLDPELAVTLFASQRLGCFGDVVIIASMLSVENIWLDIPKTSDHFNNFKMAKSAFFDERGDFFSYLRIFKKWKYEKFKHNFLKKNFLNIRSLYQVQKICNQLISMFKTDITYNENFVSQAFCAGYFMNIATLKSDRYTNIFTDTPCYIHPTSCLYKQHKKYVLYHNLFKTDREYIKVCMSVKIEDILKGANHIFKECDSEQIKNIDL